mmetsp:Transcript_22728/g.71368  ORF Transcript_22728/g.71368 Transcript_22728/m.71368 type:complete len:225 (-) Transcript_22728:191-865(-)
MYAGRMPAVCVEKSTSGPPLLACLASFTASRRISCLVLACSLKSFSCQPLLRRSRRSWIWNWMRLEKAMRPSEPLVVLRSCSRAENWDIRTFPCWVPSMVKPMERSSSQTHSIMCSSGGVSLRPTRSCTTWPMTLTARSCRRKRFPMNFMFASILSLRFFISNLRSSAECSFFSSSVGSKVLGKLSNSFWQVFSSTRVNVVAFSPSFSALNSGYRERRAKTMSA